MLHLALCCIQLTSSLCLSCFHEPASPNSLLISSFNSLLLSVHQLVDLCLLYRVTTPMPDGFWEREALNKSWWCAIRIFATALVSAAVLLVETHPFFRIYVSFHSLAPPSDSTVSLFIFSTYTLFCCCVFVYPFLSFPIFRYCTII